MDDVVIFDEPTCPECGADPQPYMYEAALVQANLVKNYEGYWMLEGVSETVEYIDNDGARLYCSKGCGMWRSDWSANKEEIDA